MASLDSGYTVYMGGILQPESEGDGVYEDLLCTNLDFLTDTNGCKWKWTSNDDYAHCTQALEFAQSCGMEYRVEIQLDSFGHKKTSSRCNLQRILGARNWTSPFMSKQYMFWQRIN